MILSYLAAAFDGVEDSRDAEVAVVVDGAEYHALALFSHHLARGKISDE